VVDIFRLLHLSFWVQEQLIFLCNRILHDKVSYPLHHLCSRIQVGKVNKLDFTQSLSMFLEDK